MATFNVPSAPTLYKESMKNFKGVDFANNATQVQSYRSPDAENIISDLAGKPVKRTGYETVTDFGSRINGIYRLATEDTEKFIVHAGTKLYEWNKADEEKDRPTIKGAEIYSDMNNERSTAFQNDKKLYILDGKTYLVYGEFDGAFKVKKVEDIATVPVCFLSLNPDGTGGTNKRDVNVLTKRRTYSFYGKADVKEYRLAASDFKIDSGAVTARKMNSDATWTDLKEGTDFSVDRTKGIITFNTAPGVSPSIGIDNVEITFSASTDYTADLINKCTIAVQYGYGGATDRVFVSGNPTAKNFHYWSDINDPAYFPGMNYAYLGQDSSAIMGYSLIGDALAVHKEDNEQDQTIFLVTGSYDETNGYQFAISNTIAGVGAVSKYCFQRLGTEPLFLARQGVYALATQYITAERYAQNRSYYVDPRLTKEADLSEAIAKEYNSNYYLAVNGHVYVADSRQKAYEKNAPQSEFQYEWYYLTNINCRVWWEYNGRLYFGDNYGKIKVFMLDEENTAVHNAYNDDGEPIRAYWDTPIFTFDTLSRYKTLKGFWLMLSPYRRSSVNIYYRVKGALTLKKHSTMDIFDFNDIDFTRFSFVTDDSPMIIATNAKAKKFMLIQFRFENNVIGEGFGFYEAEASYNVVGKYKG
mgnify:CR=1 FL=1